MERKVKALQEQPYTKRYLDVKSIMLIAIIADNLKIQRASALTPQEQYSLLEATLYSFILLSLSAASFQYSVLLIESGAINT